MSNSGTGVGPTSPCGTPRPARGRGGAAARWLAAVALVAFFFACASFEWKPIGPRNVVSVPGAEAVGAEECGVCHEQIQGHPKIAGYHANCESCHGPGSLHAEADSSQHIRYPANADCLQCHASSRDTHLQWGSGQHSRAGLLCSDCHNPHERSRQHLRPARAVGHPDMDPTSRLCSECHSDVAAELRLPSHHPVAEGKLGCTSCHDPHEDSRLRFAKAGGMCGDCHQSVTGPWVFEHPPAVEECGTCHAPHGAATDKLLTSVQPTLCLSCHSLADQFHHDVDLGAFGQPYQAGRAQAFLRNCTNCHSAVHGSHTDEHLRH